MKGLIIMKKLYVVAQINLQNDEVDEPFLSFCPTLEDAIICVKTAIEDDKYYNEVDSYYRIYECGIIHTDEGYNVFNVLFDDTKNLKKTIYPDSIV